MSGHDVGLEAKKLQYERAADDLRYFSSLTWKIPSIAGAVGAAIVATSSEVVTSQLHNGILILFGIALLGGLMIIARRYRLFEIKSTVFMKQLEVDFQNKDNLKVEIMPVEAEESQIKIKKWQKQFPSPRIRIIQRILHPSGYEILQVLLGIFIILLFMLSYNGKYLPFD